MRELLILIPGFGRVARFQQKDEFINGLVHASEKVILKRADRKGVPMGIDRIEGRSIDGVAQEYDVVEAYWSDLVPSLTQQSVKARVLRGLSLFVYWTFSGIWNGIWTRKYLSFSMMFSTLVLVFWYYGTLALFLEAIPLDSTSSQGRIIDLIKGILEGIANWKAFVIGTVLMGIVPVALIIDIMNFSKIYISEESDGPGSPAMRWQVVKRVRDQILSVIDSEEYDRITVVSHSFGTIIAVDLIADLPVPPGTRIRMVTLGSPLELLAKRAAWLNQEKANCLTRPELEEWIDVNSSIDWLATGADLPVEGKKVKMFSIRPSGTLLDRVNGAIHSRYFDNQEVARIILQQRIPERQNAAAYSTNLKIN